MTAKKAASTAKHVTATKKHAPAKKHTESASTKAAAAKKSAATRKKDKVTVKAKGATPAKASKAVGFAVGDWLPVCGFEAVAQSLRLVGQRVDDDEVLRLYDLCGSREASIGEALAAAARFGLAGCRPVRQQRLDQLGIDLGGARPVEVAQPDQLHQVVDVHGLILRIDVPGPHAVLATADGWWSWGELHDPWPCRVSEAWAVSWS